LLQKDQSRSRFGNLYKELLQAKQEYFDLLESPSAENPLFSPFAFRLFFSDLVDSAHQNRFQINVRKCLSGSPH
jgi:hypothetical protein